MTTPTRPAGSDRPANGRPVNPTTVDPDAWAELRDRATRITKWTDHAVALATDPATQPPPGRVALWRARRAAARANAAQAVGILRTPGRPAEQAGVAAPAGGRLRLVPPVAALGTAFVLQVVAMTDTVGGKLADAVAGSEVPQLADRPGLGYLAAMLLGIAVASCAEGGAAYLMDLYDKHLMARDSVWVLRLAMVGYVAASAGVIHWWLTERHLPAIVSWVLAGMSASALFLWSRGSRWRHRAAMRSAGQLDPAMPRMPMAAKVLHPVRWIVTLYLVSWEPAATPAEARERYGTWSADRQAARADRAAAKAVEAEAKKEEAEEVADLDDPAGPDHGPTALADAEFLRETYGEKPPGRNELWRRHGGNKERWTNALKAYGDGGKS